MHASILNPGHRKAVSAIAALLFAIFSATLAPLHANYVPDGSGNPVWDSPDPEPPEGPDTSDADGDGLPWWYEVYLGADPGNSDTDYDGLTDGEEVYTTATNPAYWDTDSDGISDRYDYMLTVFPYDDYDGDGLVNWFEYSGSYTDLFDWDSDDNGHSDYEDFYNTWQDGDGDGLSNSIDPYPSDVHNYSTVNNVAWGADVLGDADGDGILNFEDFTPYP
jgi:hypothetical protein